MMNISFLIVNRNGNHINEVVSRIKELYIAENIEILIIEQDDNELFKRGQLFNIGVKYARYDNLVLMDNDVYLFNKIEFKYLTKPSICFNRIIDIDETNNYSEEYKKSNDDGKILFITKQRFIEINGFSNLYLGWGSEDNDFAHRLYEFDRLNNVIGHLYHEPRKNKNNKNKELNRYFYNHRKERNSLKDGFLQTTYNLVSNENNIIKVNNISVINDFEYKESLNLHFKEQQYSILSFNFGDYDTFKEPEELDPNCEYVYVTDNKELKSNKWRIIYMESDDPIYSSFYVRYHPYEFVSNNICIVLDGSIQIKKSLSKLVKNFVNSEKDICLSIHYKVSSINTEIQRWTISKKITKEMSNDLYQLMNKMADPYELGNFESGFKIVKNNEITNILHNHVWKELTKHNYKIQRLDQTVLYAIYSIYFKSLNIFYVTRQILQNDYLQIYEHNRNIPIIENINYNKIFCNNNKIKPYIL